MHYLFLLAMWAVVLMTACASPQKVSTQSTAASARVNDREEAMPQPVLRNRYTGMEERDAMRGRTRQELQGSNTLAVIKSVQLIDMRYMLDLFEHNSKVKDVAEVLDKRDRDIRECYSQRVRTAPHLKGTLTFAFKLSRSAPGLHAIQRKGGSISDAALEACVAGELAKVPLVAYVTGRGTLRYSFNVLQKRQTVTPVVMDAAMPRELSMQRGSGR